MTVRMKLFIGHDVSTLERCKRRPSDKRSPANLDAAVGCDYRFIHHRSSNRKLKKTYSVFKCQKIEGDTKQLKRKDTSQLFCLLNNRAKPCCLLTSRKLISPACLHFSGAKTFLTIGRTQSWNFPYLKKEKFFHRFTCYYTIRSHPSQYPTLALHIFYYLIFSLIES